MSEAFQYLPDRRIGSGSDQAIVGIAPITQGVVLSMGAGHLAMGKIVPTQIQTVREEILG